MRIGYDAKRIFHNFRGLGNYGRTLLESLYKYYSEHDYFLYTPPVKDERSIRWQNKYPNMRVKTPSLFYRGIFSSIWRTFLLPSLIVQDELDIYHGLSSELPVGIEKTNVVKLVTIHDMLFYRFPQYYPWIDRQTYLAKTKISCSNCDLIISICQQTKKDLIDFLNISEEKIHVVYQSCHPKFYTPVSIDRIEQAKKRFNIKGSYILYVGALVKRKNILSLIRAFDRIYKNFDHQLVLGGEGSQRDELQQEIDGLKLNSRIIITGYVSREELPALYQGADLFVFPSTFEGFGIPIVEALFSELPVITSKGSCFPEVGGPFTTYIDCTDIEELSFSISKLLSDSYLRSEISRKSRKFAEKFHWRNTSKNMMDIYNQFA